MHTVLITYIILVNLWGFVLMGIDKRKAKKHLWRVPERTLFLTALFLGSIGILVGMRVFRHKTKHRSFTFGIPAILILQLALLVALAALHRRQMGSPVRTVKNELSLIRELDSDTIQSYISFDNLTNSHIASGAISADTAEAVALFFKQFRYDIQDVEINDNTATVHVNITNLDMRALSQDLCAEILKQTVAIYPSEEEMTINGYYQLLHDTLQANDYPKTTTIATFHLKQEESGWVILADETLEDELVSGFISCMNDPYILPVSTILSIQLDAFKALDAAQWKEYLNIEDLFATYNTEYYSEIDDAYVQALAECFDYEILRCQEQGDEATAAVRITSLDMPGILTQYKQAILGYASTTQSIRDNSTAVSNETSRLLLEALKAHEGTHSTDIDMTFHNNGNAWDIYFDETFTNAVMGDMDLAIETFNTVA